MTALHQYSRLESAGLWRNGPDAQRREVIVGLRDATIVLLDPKTESPLTQWSLPAVMRTGDYEGFVIYASHEDADETLEIDDTTMIAALDKVRAALDRRRKRPGRLRGALKVGVASAVLGVIAIWMPLRLYGFAAQRLPAAAARDIAAQAMEDVITISGSPCTGRAGVQAAADLARRLFPGAPPQIAVLREGLTGPASLPDGTILLPFSLVERADGPETLAGIVLAEHVSAKSQSPMQAALRYAGWFATLRLMSSGALPQGALAGYGPVLAKAAQPPADAAALDAAFAAAQITPAPYASFAQRSDLAPAPAAAPDPNAAPILEDAAFLGLQYICDS